MCPIFSVTLYNFSCVLLFMCNIRGNDDLAEQSWRGKCYLHPKSAHLHKKLECAECSLSAISLCKQRSSRSCEHHYAAGGRLTLRTTLRMIHRQTIMCMLEARRCGSLMLLWVLEGQAACDTLWSCTCWLEVPHLSHLRSCDVVSTVLRPFKVLLTWRPGPRAGRV